jgi:hypothetical protein
LSVYTPWLHATHLAVQIQHVKRKQVDADGDVLGADVLALTPAEVLEGKELLGGQVERDSLAVDDERLDTILNALKC